MPYDLSQFRNGLTALVETLKVRFIFSFIIRSRIANDRPNINFTFIAVFLGK